VSGGHGFMIALVNSSVTPIITPDVTFYAYTIVIPAARSGVSACSGRPFSDDPVFTGVFSTRPPATPDPAGC
jgi:hypothetical protein